MLRASYRKAHIGVEALEGRNLTAAISGQILATAVGTLAVRSSTGLDRE